jgi:ArsR family transcriptional regulator
MIIIDKAHAYSCPVEEKASDKMADARHPDKLYEVYRIYRGTFGIEKGKAAPTDTCLVMQPCNNSLNPEQCLFIRHAQFCSLFSDPNRLRILFFIGDGERSVGEMATKLGLTMPHISQHLRVMRDRGCLIVRREGRAAYYRVANAKFLMAAQLVREGIAEVLREGAAAMASPR